MIDLFLQDGEDAGWRFCPGRPVETVVAAIGTPLRNTIARWVAKLTMISIGPLGATPGAQTNCPGLSLAKVSSGEVPPSGTCCAKAALVSARTHRKVARNLVIGRGELSPARACRNHAKGVDGSARKKWFLG